MHGNVIPSIDGKKTFTCTLLAKDADYVGFNGNRLLKGRGYLIASPGGWMAKAGYSHDQVSSFIEDLDVLATKLNLIPVAIEKHNTVCLDLAQLSTLFRSARATNVLERIHLRIYAPADYLHKWNQLFSWSEKIPERASVSTNLIAALISMIDKRIVTQRQLAQELDVDSSLLNKIISGKKPWPEGLLVRATTWLNSRNNDNQ
jgi:hypothetical protein